MVDRRTKGSTEQTVGWIFLALGFLSWSGSLLVDRGFIHGAFQGAAIVAMLLAAGCFGASIRSARETGADDDSEFWLPSRDGDR